MWPFKKNTSASSAPRTEAANSHTETAPMSDVALLDFHTAVGETLCEVLDGLVDRDYLDPHEAAEPIYTLVGKQSTPDALRGVSDADIQRLAAEYGRYLECEGETVTPEHVRQALHASLDRWQSA